MDLLITHEPDNVTHRRAHNEQQLVSQLIRSGVFHDIFSYLAHTYPPGRSRNGPYPLGFIYITHVCASLRYWALETSALWARHVCAFGAEQVFQVLLKRAGTFPITIDNVRDYTLVNDRRRVYRIPEHYFSAIARAASVNLVADPGQMMRVRRELCERSAPYLATLKLHCSRGPGISADGADDEETFDRDLSPSIQPDLKHVELIGIYIPITGQNIVSLRISGERGNWQPTLHEILRMLRPCVKLESLRLLRFKRASPLDSPDVAASHTVHLPSLVELVLKGRSALDLSCHLKHPPLDVASVIQTAGDQTTIEDIKSSLSSLLGGRHHLSASLQKKPSMYLLRFYDSPDSGLGLLLSIYTSKSYIGDRRLTGSQPPNEPLGLCYPYCGRDASDPQLTLSVSGLNPAYGIMRGGATFLEEVFTMQRSLVPDSLDTIERVHISIYPARPLDWHMVLAPFTSAHTLILACDQPSFKESDGLVDALAEAGADNAFLLPALETILTNKKVPWRPRDYMPFREMLAARAAHGAPVLSVRSLSEHDMSNALMKKYYVDLVRLPDGEHLLRS